jgi:hypothetical protein
MEDTRDFDDHLNQLLEQEKNRKPSPFTGTRILQRLDDEFTQPRPMPVYYRLRLVQPVIIVSALAAGIFIGSHLSAFQHDAGDETASISDIDQIRTDLFIGDLTHDDHVFQFNTEQP